MKRKTLYHALGSYSIDYQDKSGIYSHNINVVVKAVDKKEGVNLVKKYFRDKVNQNFCRHCNGKKPKIIFEGLQCHYLEIIQ